jgi:ribonuclease BN (tRNA processing enzyme)
MLIHDCQYTDAEYPHHLGWGHSPLADALAFGHRVGAQKLLLFHHDPLHSDDFLDSFSGEVCARWEELGGAPAQVELAAERRELMVNGAEPQLTQPVEQLG